MLTRRFVGKRLAEYYAQPADRVVGTSSAIDQSNLSSLLGEWHWKRFLRQLYDNRQGHWLTPVELFRPHYSNILANFIIKQQQQSNENDIDIFEFGGGRGTNASLILSRIRQQQPELYSRLSYTIIDSSPSLLEMQAQTIAQYDHSNVVKFELKDLLDVAENRTQLVPKSKRQTFVLALELLDNLPHDKIRAKSKRKIEQAQVRKVKTTTKTVANDGGNDDGDDDVVVEKYKEEFVPLSDPLLSKILQTVPSLANPSPIWIPSVACAVLDQLAMQRPNASVVMADFDWLPEPDLKSDIPRRRQSSTWAKGEPIVTDMEGVDYECYLEGPPLCDILFPTDFRTLASFVKRSSWKQQQHDIVVSVEKQADFLARYGPDEVRATQSWLTGHTPLLDDFSNCSVLTITRRKQQQQ